MDSTFEWMAENDHKLIAKIYFRFWNTIGSFKYYVLQRGKCWLIGCDEHRGSSGYLPEDCTEWWCDRCGAEGINHMVTTRETLYGFIPTMKERLYGLPGRIQQKLCRHDFKPHHANYQFTEGVEVGSCTKCHKYYRRSNEVHSTG